MMPDRELSRLGDLQWARDQIAADAELGKGAEEAYAHFSRRVRERMGADVSALSIWVALRYAVRHLDRDLAFCLGRLPDYRRAWQFRGPCGGFFVAIYDHTGDVPVTVLTAAQFADTRSRRRAFLGTRLVS